MNVRATSARRPARWAILPAVAMIGVLAGLSNAFADQQATDDEMDNAMNWQAARGPSHSGAYAQFTPAWHHRNYR